MHVQGYCGRPDDWKAFSDLPGIHALWRPTGRFIGKSAELVSLADDKVLVVTETRFVGLLQRITITVEGRTYEQLQKRNHVASTLVTPRQLVDVATGQTVLTVVNINFDRKDDGVISTAS